MPGSSPGMTSGCALLQLRLQRRLLMKRKLPAVRALHIPAADGEFFGKRHGITPGRLERLSGGVTINFRCRFQRHGFR
jgi:hypothetical protein